MGGLGTKNRILEKSMGIAILGYVFFVSLAAFFPDSKDRVLVHFDKPYYTAGETINFKLYLPQKYLEKELMIKIEIYNPEGEAVHSSYLKSYNDHVAGYYDIPYQIEPGMYLFRATASTSYKSEVLTLLQAHIPVYSERLLDSPNSFTDSTRTLTTDDIGELRVDIQISNRDFQPRDSISLSVLVKDPSGKPLKAVASISVRDVQLIGENPQTPAIYTASSQYDSQQLSDFIQLQGHLMGSGPREMVAFKFAENNQMLYSITDENGDFFLVLPEFYGNQVLQYIPQYSQQRELRWASTGPSTTSFEKLPLSPSVQRYLQESRDRKLIYQLFNRVEPGPIKTSSPHLVTPIPDFRFEADNYPFTDLQTFSREVVSPLKFIREKRGTGYFQMFDPDSRSMAFGTPLFIIDGQLTKHQKTLTSLDFQKLREIKLYSRTTTISEYFGFAGFSGVVEIVSKEGLMKIDSSYLLKSFQIDGLQPVSEYSSPNLPMDQPYLVPLIYWNPKISTTLELGQTVGFRHSDDRGEFKIEVVAQSEDGRRGYGIILYQVR